MDEAGEQRTVTEREREHQQPGADTVPGDDHGDPDGPDASWEGEDEPARAGEGDGTAG